MTPHERQRLEAAMSRLRDGDRSAFDEVYGLLWPLVRGYVRNALGNDESDDVAQEVLLRIFEQSSEFDAARGSAVSWSLSIAAWQCRTVLRRRQRSRLELVAHEPEVGDDSASPEETAVARQLVAAARETLATLRESDVEAIMIRVEGRRPDHVSQPTFRKRLQRAHERLRRAWRSRYGMS